jgi:hypothetical protein
MVGRPCAANVSGRAAFLQAIGELICSHPGEITLIATGPLTNVAIALQLYPEIVHTVKNIVIMGGVFNVAGYIKDTNLVWILKRHTPYSPAARLSRWCRWMSPRKRKCFIAIWIVWLR